MKSQYRDRKIIRIRAHELNVIYIAFILNDKEFVYEMMTKTRGYGEEFAGASKRFIENLKPTDLVQLVDSHGDLCDLAPGCPYKGKNGSCISGNAKNRVHSAEIMAKYDRDKAIEYGVEIGRPYLFSELLEKLNSLNPENLKQYKEWENILDLLYSNR